jgi:ankyrin repeat protein
MNLGHILLFSVRCSHTAAGVMSLHLLIGCVVAAVQDGWTATMGAAENGHGECLKALVEAKADVNLQSKVPVCVVRGLGAWSPIARVIAGFDGAPQVV